MEPKELIALAVQLAAPQIRDRVSNTATPSTADLLELLEASYMLVKTFSDSKLTQPTGAIYTKS